MIPTVSKSHRTNLWGTFVTCRWFGTLQTCPTGWSGNSLRHCCGCRHAVHSPKIAPPTTNIPRKGSPLIPPTPPDHFASRRQRLAECLAVEGLDALLVSQPVNVSYLTGFSGDSSYLLVTPRRSVLVSDGRFTQQLAQECPAWKRHPRTVTPLTEATARALAQLGAHTVGFESGHLTVADLEALRSAAAGIDWKGARDRVELLRACKDATEIAQIREAIDIAQRAFAMFRAFLRADDCEKDLSDAVEAYIRRAGGRGSSFPAIVAVGDRAALPHAPPTFRKVAENPLLLLDWGASGTFYKSDLTRVLWTRTNSSRRQQPGNNSAERKFQEIYEVVLRAQTEAIRALRPGVQTGQVDAAARSVIVRRGMGSFLPTVPVTAWDCRFTRHPCCGELRRGFAGGYGGDHRAGHIPPGVGRRPYRRRRAPHPGRHEVLTSVPKDLASAVLAC